MRKRRTREHIIADLSVNHVERFILRAGHTAERVYRDYGYDLLVFTFDENGEAETDFIAIQLKATDAPRSIDNGNEIALTIERRDWDYWQEAGAPVILILFDGQTEGARWLHVQAYKPVSQTGEKQTLSVRFSRSQSVDENSVAEWRRIKNRQVAKKRQNFDSAS